MAIIMWFKPVTLHKKAIGFTLVEMMITVAIMAIGLGLAAPSLSDFIKNNRMTEVSNKLVSAIIQARNEAVTRRSTVTLTPDDAEWSAWTVAVIPLTTTTPFPIANYTLETGTVLIPSNSSITGTGLRFTPNGFRDLSQSTASFYFELCAEDIDTTREIHVSAAGTTNVVKGTGGCP